MSQEIIDYAPSFTGKSGKIEQLLRDLGQRPADEQIPLKLTEMATALDVARSLVRYVYDGLEKEGVPLPPRRGQGRPATRTRCEPTRPHLAVTGDKDDEATTRIRDLLKEGKTYDEIEEETGFTRGQTQYRVKLELAPRQHNRRSPEKIDLFDCEVETLLQARDSSGEDMTYSDIAEQLEPFHPGTTYFDVYNSTQRLRNQGRIEIPGTQEETWL